MRIQFIDEKVVTSLLLGLVVDEGQVAPATVVTVKVICHEDAGAALLVLTLASESGDFAVVVHLVELKHRQLNLLLLVLVLLGGGVVLLLALLGTTTESEDQVEGRLLLDIVVRKGAAVLELFTGEDETLLVGRDALLVLDLCLHILDRIRGLDLEGDGLAREGLHKDLHVCSSPEFGGGVLVGGADEGWISTERTEVGKTENKK